MNNSFAGKVEMDVSGDGYYIHPNSYPQPPVHTDGIQNVTSSNFVGIGADDEHSAAAHSQSNHRLVNQRLQQQMPMPVPNGIVKNQLNLPPDIVPHVMENRQKQQTMPPTPPGESASADENDQDEDRRRILLNMIPNNGIQSVQTSNSMLTSLPQHYHNPLNMTGPPNVNPPHMMLMQPNNSQANGFHMPHGPPPTAYSFNPHMVNLQDQQQLDDDLQDDMLDDDEMSASTKESKRRNNKRAVSENDKDDRYFERRKRNNMAAKRSRDARKVREEHIGMRANFLEKENAMLHAQLSTLREEANALRQLLNQRTMIPPSSQHQLGPVGQGMPPPAHQGMPQQ